ncbi:M23 family metallopeptidase [Erythrobacter sp. F6033]|uniref:M23 family metallopeptidase n=1 Tax=Erythrobacter sp. F6033 TaxID=2926401 RepID=UPI001FF4EAFA|nr:M23 family metallopeptidase [Erythrobacter sp. F6033]MCK0129620.1 M23 family metallopeptidase [Erythrobacter sp. F6033]
MNTLFKRPISKATAAVVAAASLIAAAPAAANTANTANTSTATADITQPIEEAKAESLNTGDPRFRQLFASWTALDEKGPGAPVTQQPVVSVPSRSPLSNSTLTSGYGMRNHPVLRRRARHKGVDLAAPTGTPIYATADGIIERADWFSSYGLYISIDHGSDLETRYAHMSRLAVAAGDTVRKGDVIGYVGSTGRSTGPHLHYEVRVDGVAVNPIPYMLETETQVAASNQATLTGRGGK